MIWPIVALGLIISGCVSGRLTVPIVPPLVAPSRFDVFWTEPFDKLDPARWREMEVHGHTRYEAATIDGRACLKASTDRAASILLSSVRFDPKVYDKLSWSWRVDKLVDGEALMRKDGSDAPARVYIYFDTKGLPWQKYNLDYVWSGSLAIGTVLESAYSSTSKIIVVESGERSLGKWVSVSRNINEDYRQAFGKSAPDVVAIGIISDSDSTGASAIAYFDDLKVSR